VGAIRQRFAELRRYPMAGAERAEFDTAYRTVSVGQHVIFYRIAADLIEIVRVLHVRMDVHRHLPDRQSE
jgi:toxin ParE1/3/4